MTVWRLAETMPHTRFGAGHEPQKSLPRPLLYTFTGVSSEVSMKIFDYIAVQLCCRKAGIRRNLPRRIADGISRSHIGASPDDRGEAANGAHW
jgi:hypothetical protein